MKKFAYIDKAGIMHITKDMQTAISYAQKGTTVIETEVEASGGYPVVKGEEIIVYSPEVMKIDAQGGKIKVIPELAELYKKCAGK